MFAVKLEHVITGATIWVEVTQEEEMLTAIDRPLNEYQIIDHTFPVTIDVQEDFATLAAIAREVDIWGGDAFRCAALLCNRDLEATLELLEFRQALLNKAC
jgi:hypothetical protein